LEQRRFCRRLRFTGYAAGTRKEASRARDKSWVLRRQFLRWQYGQRGLMSGSNAPSISRWKSWFGALPTFPGKVRLIDAADIRVRRSTVVKVILEAV